MRGDLQTRIDRRFAAWLDVEVERDVPADLFGPGVQADYRDAIENTSIGKLARARIAVEEAIAAPILKALVIVLDKTRVGR